MSYEKLDLIITKRVLNDNTGELESQDYRSIPKKSSIRGGFNLMYHKSYEEVIEQAIKSNTDIKLFNWITNKFTYQRTETTLVFSECNIDLSQPQFSRMIKRLIELNYLKRISRGIYRLNPFIYIPYKANAVELQSEWKNYND